jgi:ABC-2 type transport system ATP-binding protein
MSDEIIHVEALRKEYYEVVAVDDVSLSVAADAIHGLIGPNGAGKTTLLRMLATTLEPTSGRIRFEGEDIWRDPVAIRAKMGFMPDFFQMYDNVKVGELLTYFGIAHGLRGGALRQRVDEVIELTDLAEKRETFCRGLSRGMVQRLGLGRAILHRPKLLLLDEPASGLDPLARRKLFELLRKVRQDGTTIIISSHILAELSDLCTSVIIMHEGRFLESGPTAEIVKKIMPKRQITLSLSGGAEPAGKVLSEHPRVSAVRPAEGKLSFLFDGGDAELAALNAALVAAGAGVALVEEERTSLHELYFTIAERNQHAASA